MGVGCGAAILHRKSSSASKPRQWDGHGPKTGHNAKEEEEEEGGGGGKGEVRSSQSDVFIE